MYACKPYLLCYMDRHIGASVLPCIKVLNFEDNLLARWSEVKKLAVLPRYSAPVLLDQFGEMLSILSSHVALSLHTSALLMPNFDVI